MDYIFSFRDTLYAGHPSMACSVDPNVVISLAYGVYVRCRSTRVYYRYPIIDFSVEPIHNIGYAVEKIAYHLGRGDRVYVHCLAGCGRTCTVVSTYLILYHGYRWGDAVEEYLRQRGCYIESSEQEVFLKTIDYLKHKKGYDTREIIELLKACTSLEELLKEVKRVNE